MSSSAGTSNWDLTAPTIHGTANESIRVADAFNDIYVEVFGKADVSIELHTLCHGLHTFAGIGIGLVEVVEMLKSMDQEEVLKIERLMRHSSTVWLYRANAGRPSASDLNWAGDYMKLSAKDKKELDIQQYVPSICSGVTERSVDQAQKAMQRDGGRCVITGWTKIDVAHVIPYSIGKHPDPTAADNNYKSFYLMLDMFMEPKKFERLKHSLLQPGQCNVVDDLNLIYTKSDTKRDIFPPTSINRLQNLICLYKVLHDAFGRGELVLEPIRPVPPLPSCDAGSPPAEYTYKVRVSFISGTNLTTRTRVAINEPVRWMTKEEEDQSLQDMGIFVKDAGAPLKTGMEFKLRTDDQLLLPLPDPEYLEIHAALSRLMRMAGRANDTDLFGNRYEPEEIIFPDIPQFLHFLQRRRSKNVADPLRGP